MINAHTPGPWTLEIDAANLHPWSIVDSSPNKLPLCLLNPMLGDGESEANARLIAAAPDLLAALDAILNGFATGEFDVTKKRYSDDDPYNSTLMKADAAIRKAKGADQ